MVDVILHFDQNLLLIPFLVGLLILLLLLVNIGSPVLHTGLVLTNAPVLQVAWTLFLDGAGTPGRPFSCC